MSDGCLPEYSGESLFADSLDARFNKLLRANLCVCGEQGVPTRPFDKWIEQGYKYAVGCGSLTCPRIACGETPWVAVRRWNAWQLSSQEILTTRFKT